jgi:hypothetical protein
MICVQLPAAKPLVRKPPRRFSQRHSTPIADSTILSVRLDFAAGMRRKEIARKYGLKTEVVWKITEYVLAENRCIVIY